MFISVFKTSRIYLPILLIIVTFLLWLDGFWFYSQTSIPAEQPAPLYSMLVSFLETNKFLNVLLGFVFLILQAFLLNHVITSKNLVDRHSYMPGFIYAVLMSSSFDMYAFHPVLIANFFLIIILGKIIASFKEDKVYLEIFNVGLLVGVASLFYVPAILFIVIALIALFMYFLASLRGIIATLTGFITPFFFISVYYFLTDQLLIRIHEFTDISITFMTFSLDIETYFHAYTVLFAIITFIALIKVYLVVIKDNPVRIRKRYNILLFFLVISLISLIFITDENIVSHGLVNIPVAAILACFFHHNKKKFWNELLFSLLIIFMLAVKFEGLIN